MSLHEFSAPAGGATGGSPAFRKATGADASALHDVAAVTFPLACPPHTTAEAIADFIATQLSVDAFERYLADPQRELFVVESDGAAIAYAMVVYGDPKDADVAAAVVARPAAELSKLYVLPDHHGGGLAASLVDTVVASATARGASVLWLGTNQENGRANRFYEKVGFTLAGTKKFLVGDRYEDDNVWARSLPV